MRALLLALPCIAIGSFAAQAEDQKTPEPYAPGLGDFMTAYVQPHHVKLWEAGHAGNWPLAEYEADELKETFEDVASYQAVWHDLPIAKMVETMLSPPLAAVAKAIENRSQAGFDKAYGQLTAGCNACHTATKHEFIVIKVPAGTAFPDQQFAPR